MSRDRRTECLRVPDYGEMIERPRLLELFDRTRPRVVLVSAPAAYGKSVLAAQMAGRTRFSDAVWVRLPAGCATSGQVLSAVIERLSTKAYNGRSQGLPLAPRPGVSDLIEQLRALLDEQAGGALCFVLDDLDPRAIGVLEDMGDILSEPGCPVACVVATIRQGGATACADVAALQIGATNLLLDDAEACEVAEAVLGIRPDEALMEALVDASGRQPGLLSVVAKLLAARPTSSRSVLSEHPHIAVLLRRLAEDQLSDAQKRTLQCMAILCEGQLDDLTSQRFGGSVAQDVEVIAATLPLISALGPRSSSFRVHDIAQRVFADPAGLHRDDPQLLEMLMQRLAQRGDEVRLLQLAVNSGDVDLLIRWVARVGHALVSRGALGSLHHAFGAIPTVRLVGEPHLLVLKAILEWESGHADEAQRSAQVAREVAEHDGDDGASADALVVLMQISFGMGDYVLARAYADRAAAILAARGAEVLLAHIHGRRVLMNALLGDFAKYSEASSDAEELIRRMRGAEEAAAQLRFFVATSRIAIRGDWAGAVPELEAASRCERLGHSLRVSAAFNYCAAAVEMGRVDKALGLLGELQVLLTSGTSQGASEVTRSLTIGIEATAGRIDADPSEQLRSASASWYLGERLATVTSLTSASIALLGNRAFPGALSVSEQALCYARDMGAPALVWLAKLEYAAGMLSLGDEFQAGRLVVQVHDAVSASLAAGLHLKADAILAEIDCRHADTAAAVARFAEHADYILSESANWQLAMYIRAFPGLLGPLAAAIGAGNVPVHLLNMILPRYATEAIAAARGVLPRADLDLLSTRLLGMPAAGRRASDRATTQDTCEVGLFGGLRVDVAGRVVRDKEWRKRKARLLFAMLTSRCGKDIPREQLTEYLWPEMDEAQALNNLYVVWSSMKHALLPGSGRADRCPYVEHRGGVCRAVQSHVRTDLDDFDGQVALAAKARTAGDEPAEMAALQRIAEIYRGELLPGEVYDDWFATLRERCRHDFEDAMLRAAQLLERRGDLQGGLGLLRRALQHDPWREDLYQEALRLQIISGQRSAAIETYLTCRTRLVDDLGIDPSAETTRLYEQVLGMEDGPCGLGYRVPVA